MESKKIILSFNHKYIMVYGMFVDFKIIILKVVSMIIYVLIYIIKNFTVTNIKLNSYNILKIEIVLLCKSTFYVFLSLHFTILENLF